MELGLKVKYWDMDFIHNAPPPPQKVEKSCLYFFKKNVLVKNETKETAGSLYQFMTMVYTKI